jgi:hypothetical protein
VAERRGVRQLAAPAAGGAGTGRAVTDRTFKQVVATISRIEAQRAQVERNQQLPRQKKRAQVDAIVSREQSTLDSLEQVLNEAGNQFGRARMYELQGNHEAVNTLARTFDLGLDAVASPHPPNRPVVRQIGLPIVPVELGLRKGTG